MPICLFYHHSNLLHSHTTLLVIYIHSYIHSEKILIPVCTCICKCIVIDININQPHPFGYLQDTCGMAKGTWCHIAAQKFCYIMALMGPAGLLNHLWLFLQDENILMTWMKSHMINTMVNWSVKLRIMKRIIVIP